MGQISPLSGSVRQAGKAANGVQLPEPRIGRQAGARWQSGRSAVRFSVMRWLPGLLLAGLALRADEVVLRDGKVVEGKVQDLGDEVRLTRGGNTITYPKAMVREIRYGPTREEQYEARRREIDPRSLEQVLELARWCEGIGLKAEAKREFEAAITIDPDCEEARRALGYRRVGDRWMTEEEEMRARGLVRYRGRWVTPEEKEIEEEMEKIRKEEQALVVEARRRVLQLEDKDPDRVQEAMDALGKIPWSLKVKVFTAALRHKSDRIRRYVAKELGMSGSKVPGRALARAWLEDPDEDVRALADQSLDALAAEEERTAMLREALDSEDGEVRRRAIRGTRDRQVKALIGPLIERMAAAFRLRNNLAEIVFGVTHAGFEPLRELQPKEAAGRNPERELQLEQYRRKIGEFDREIDEIVEALELLTAQKFGRALNDWKQWAQTQKKLEEMKEKEGE